MTEPHAQNNSRSWIAWLVIIVVAVVAGLGVWWWTGRDDAAPAVSPAPSVTPSPSATPSATPSPSVTPSATPTATVAAPSMSDINGRWCASSEPDQCLTFELPYVSDDDGADPPRVVYPWDADVSQDPSTYDYDVPPTTGGCWQATIDYWPGESGAPLIFCPAGTDGAGEFADMPGPTDADRLWIWFERPDDPPYLRAD
ncbi:hypothetical protein [Demequina sp.]|uniref:hypothetical protein n=1 Tax=Demequina sp. TaxID=2050685 RepID=UPI003D0F5059